MTKKERAAAVTALLKEVYPDAVCALHYTHDYELLFATRLSAQCTDARVNIVTDTLFRQFPTLESFAAAPEEEIAEAIKSCGLFRTKARDLKACAVMLLEQFDGKVPDNMTDLLKLPGVGRKTDNVVLSVGFGQQRIAVDTHVFRVANRIGLTNEKDVLKTELALMQRIPQERWSRTHHSLIFHGRQCCEARKPKCDACPLVEYCDYVSSN